MVESSVQRARDKEIGKVIGVSRPRRSGPSRVPSVVGPRLDGPRSTGAMMHLLRRGFLDVMTDDPHVQCD